MGAHRLHRRAAHGVPAALPADAGAGRHEPAVGEGRRRDPATRPRSSCRSRSVAESDPLAAVAGAVAFGASQGLLRVASAAWSEAPYAAISLGMIVVLGTTRMTPRVAALGGVIAGSFLTRYAGIGLAATGLAMVVVGARAANACPATLAARALARCSVRRLHLPSQWWSSSAGGSSGTSTHGRGVRAAVRGWRLRGSDDPAGAAAAGHRRARCRRPPVRCGGEGRRAGCRGCAGDGGRGSCRRRPVHPLDAGRLPSR